MSDASSGFDPQQLWQGRPKVHTPVTLGEIHARADAFEKVSRRRRIEGWFCIVLGVVMIAPVWIRTETADWMFRYGGVLCLAGCVIVGWRWLRINSIQPLPSNGEALVEAYRNNLIRVRDGRREFFWRLLAILPGAVMVFSARWLSRDSLGHTSPTDHLIMVFGLAAMALVVVSGWLWNKLQVERMQRKIDEL
jgi:hypothetical protein